MSVLDDLFGQESTALQFFTWAVLAEAVRALLAPFLQQLAQDAMSEHPTTVLSPAILADLVVRSYMTQDAGAAAARLSGISEADFQLLVDDTGEPPPTEFLLEAYRRGLINLDQPSDIGPSLVQGIHESRVKDEWITLIDAMRTNILSGAEWVEALLRGQVDRPTAVTGAYQAGMTEADFQVLLDTAGNPPSPGELVEFVRRGFIPLQGTGPDALTFQQGIFEGDAKDKWEPLYEKLVNYIPPPRTIVTLERTGVITMAEAQALYQQNGLSPELAAAYTASATALKLQPERLLAKTTILQLYQQRMINEAQATELLTQLGYFGNEPAFMLALQDAQRSIKAVNTAVTRTGTLYIGRKISSSTAQSTLASLAIPQDQITELLATWDLERIASVKLLTETQIQQAVEYAIVDGPTAVQLLMDLGLSQYDAWIIASIGNKGPLPDAPSPAPGPEGNVA